MNKRESQVIKSWNVLSPEQVQSIIDNKIVESYEDITAIKTQKQMVINLSNPANVVRTLGRIGYVSGSMVGIITKLVEVSTVLMDMEYNKQFLKKDAQGNYINEVDMFLFSKVFLGAKVKGSVQGYKEIFANTDVETKIFFAKYEDGRMIELTKATKKDINTFVSQILNAATLTKEDLVRIGRDLEKIGRLMQEIEIDSAKNPAIKEDMKEITEFMNAFACKLASSKVGIKNNFDKIVNALKYGKEGAVHDVEFKYELEDFIAISEIPEIIAQFEATVDKDTTLTPEQKDKKKEAYRDFMLKKSVIKDGAFKLKQEMVEQQLHDLNQLVEMYKNSDMRIFNEFMTVNIPGKEQAVANVTWLAVFACSIINSHFAYKDFMSMNKLEEVAATLRNAIYSYGKKVGLTERETFRVAVSAGWRKIDRGQISMNKNFRYKAIEAMFTTELKWHFNASAMYSSVEVEIPAGYGVEINVPLQMANGAYEVTLENGETDYITCLSEPDYTGLVIPQVIDGVPKFIKYENPFAYTYIEFLTFDELNDIKRVESKYFGADAVEVKENAFVAAKETDTRKLTEEKAEEAKANDAKRFSKLINDWSDLIQISVANKAVYKLTGRNSIKNGRTYISLNNKQSNAFKGLGRLLVANKDRDLTEYNKMDIIACPAGAITVLRIVEEQK